MKNILLITLILTSFSINSFAQNELKIVEPTKEFTPNLGKQNQKELERQNQLLEKEVLNDSEQKELDKLLAKYGETVSSIWDVIDGGCSWYCGGGNYKITASSELSSQGKNSYIAKSANDLNYKTAWVEAKKDAGIGEYIEFVFKNTSPRITSILIANGYMKSDLAWKNNNRVKLLKLYVNGKPYRILKLNDTKTDQEFKIGTFGHNPNGTDLILRFEIMEVYKGVKYNDTAITEIYFDGIDVH